uniref:Rhamnulokinase n=1 Tax=uncultured Armatimonadetes bacterium TaxID=157466 RepID=A0A6J4IUU3_9BACT|nr:Rhamnulokinase [uncultured Armatimonadetes bacterium]
MADRYLALDMGAESGRGVVGTLEQGKLRLEEVHRFPNGPVRMGDTLYWDLPRQHQEQLTAIGKAHAGGALSAIGVDTWGVDFGLMDARGGLIGLPVHYRDARTNGMVERVFGRVPRAEVFARTGIQTMQINTLFQLAALAEQSPRLLDAADRLLFIPDLFHHFLSGQTDAEFSDATTSQMYDPRAGDWARGMLEQAGVPTHFLPPVVPPGTACGPLLPHVAEATGAGAVPVIAPAGHDTACAVAAVPAEGRSGWAYLSSGTWSLLGVEVREPVINAESEAANFTNEGGVEGTFRLLKNIGGLWLVQECRRAYARLGDDRPYDKLTRLAGDAPALAAFVDPDHPSLLAPPDMPRALRELCAATGQTPPEGVGATIRCALDSLALKYRWTLERLEQITGEPVHTLHIVGGGTQNTLLNQLAADATGRLVKAGPVEATAAGNVLLQAMAQGRLGSLDELRAVVRASFPIDTYEPAAADKAGWDDAYGRFKAML